MTDPSSSLSAQIRSLQGEIQARELAAGQAAVDGPDDFEAWRCEQEAEFLRQIGSRLSSLAGQIAQLEDDYARKAQPVNETTDPATASDGKGQPDREESESVALRALLHRIVTGDGAQLENLDMSDEEWTCVIEDLMGQGDDVEVTMRREDWIDLIRYVRAHQECPHGGTLGACSWCDLRDDGGLPERRAPLSPSPEGTT